MTFCPFDVEITGLRNLGNGVAYSVKGQELDRLHSSLKSIFSQHLSPQDSQGFRGHITIQNKVSPGQAKSLLAERAADFQPFIASASGVDLWEYLGGPWIYKDFFPFR